MIENRNTNTAKGYNPAFHYSFKVSKVAKFLALK